MDIDATHFGTADSRSSDSRTTEFRTTEFRTTDFDPVDTGTGDPGLGTTEFDETGKASFDSIYTQPDPRAYFSTLGTLDYQIPQAAKPVFLDLIREWRDDHDGAVPQVLDIGCSYGVNAALLRCDATMTELRARYTGAAVADADRSRLVRRDRELVDSRDDGELARFVGLDASRPALGYARAAGFLDAAVHADLEAGELSAAQRAEIAGTDLVVSTGCLGYVTERTLLRVLDAVPDRLPRMAHFVLRMFPFDPIEEALADVGYETVRTDGAFRQRRFASPEEQSLVFDTMAEAGVDPTGLETDGWLYAELHLSRPRDEKG